MIYTSRYSNPELKSGKYTTVRISLGTPKWISARGMTTGVTDEHSQRGGWREQARLSLNSTTRHLTRWKSYAVQL